MAQEQQASNVGSRRTTNFGSEQSGSTHNDRFTVPRASVSYDSFGRPTCGLSAKPSRYINQHAFEADKAEANLASSARATAPPCGQRNAAKAAMQEQYMATRGLDGQWALPKQPPSREHMTSSDNPLSAALSGQRALAKMQSRRNYAVAELPPALRGHLAVGTMLPSARADGEEGEGDGVVLLEVQQQQQREGSDAAGAGGGAEQQESEEEALAAARQLEADLCRQYPHGVPKLVLARLRAEGKLVGDLPTISFSAAR